MNEAQRQAAYEEVMRAKQYVEPRKLTRRNDEATSQAAAVANVLGKNANRTTCLRAHLAGGITFDEVATATGLSEHETGRRCADLRSKGLIAWRRYPNGKLVTRATRSGREAGVCEITDAGREALA